MALVDLKIPKKTQKEMEKGSMPIESEREQYPYGARLDFNKSEVDKIKILQTIQAGAMVEIKAKAKVTSVRTDDTEKGRKRHNVEIQIHKIDITNTKFEEAEKEAAFKEGASK